jgi:Sortase domain
VRAGRDTCASTGVGFYRVSPYGVRWYGDYRGVVAGRRHLFCLDLRYWYASRAYRYRPAPAAALRNRDGVRVPAANRRRMAYALARFGRTTHPGQQAAVMLYVHSLMGDARPGELDPAAAGPGVASLLARIARASARYAGPYRVSASLPAKLVVGIPATATLRVISAAGAALPDVPLAVSATGATGAPGAARTNADGVARVAFVPASASGLSLRVETGPLPGTEPLVFVPTAGASRANGQRLAGAAPARRVTSTVTHPVTAAPLLTANATPASTTVGASTSDTVVVSRTGGSSTSVQVELWGPFDSADEIACTGTPMWTGSFVANGDSTTATAPVTLQKAGWYGYLAAIPSGASTACGAAAQRVFAVARPALATTASAAVVRRGGSVSDTIAVGGLGGAAATVQAALYGPFASREAVRCTAPHRVWSGTVDVAAGETTVKTPPVRVARAGFYGFREQVAATPAVAAAATPCAPAGETVLAAPEIVTGRGDVAAYTASPGGGARRPVRIRIASLGVDAPVDASGIDVVHDVLGIPSDVHRVGWWRDGAEPGDATGTVLVAGHVDSAAAGMGAFFPLDDARAGDAVEIDTASGRRFAYRVVSVRTVGKEALPTGVYAPGGAARLVLVTCGGTFDAATGHYPDDVVVTAVPAG